MDDIRLYDVALAQSEIDELLGPILPQVPAIEGPGAVVLALLLVLGGATLGSAALGRRCSRIPKRRAAVEPAPARREDTTE